MSQRLGVVPAPVHPASRLPSPGVRQVPVETLAIVGPRTAPHFAADR